MFRPSRIKPPTSGPEVAVTIALGERLDRSSAFTGNHTSGMPVGLALCRAQPQKLSRADGARVRRERAHADRQVPAPGDRHRRTVRTDVGQMDIIGEWAWLLPAASCRWASRPWSMARTYERASLPGTTSRAGVGA
jgi:hypothetical protein